MALHLSLFSLPRVQDGEQQAAFPLIKPTFLLVFLALRGEWVSREELTRLLRGADDEGASLGSLRLLLTRARRLESGGFMLAGGLEAQPRRVRWQVASDVKLFRQSLVQRRWAEATSLYAAPLLHGLPTVNLPGVQEWLDGERAALHGLWLAAVSGHEQALLESGNVDEAARLLRRALTFDPLSEETLQRFVRASVQAGRREEALHAAERFTARLQSDLGLTPTPATLTLIEMVRQAGPSSAPAPPSGGQGIGKQGMGGQVAQSRAAALQPALIGRGAERRSLLAQTQNVVLLSGEPGVGKTRLLSELWPPDTWIRGAWIRCAEGLEHLPYFPVLNAVRARLQDLPDLGAYASDLARFLPEITAAPSGQEADHDSHRVRLFEAFGRAIGVLQAAGTGGAAQTLVIDDLQWADAGTLEWLRFLAQRGARVQGAFRSGEVGEALRQTLSALGTNLKVVTLGPLTKPEVVQLARAAAPMQEASGLAGATVLARASGPFFDWLHRSSGGNPLFVLEWLRARQHGTSAGPQPSEPDPGPLDIRQLDIRQLDARQLETLRPPPALSELALRRIAGLGAEDRRVLDVASVLGSALTPARLARVLELSEWEVSAALTQAAERGLLRGEAFAHDLFRHALYGELPEVHRRFLHGRVARALEGDLDDLLLAEHAHLANDQAAAARLWFRVARFSYGAGRGFEDEASALYRRVLTLGVRPPEWYQACAFLAVRERVAGRADEARALIETVVRESSDALARAIARAEGAYLAYLEGDMAQASELAQLAAQEAAPLDDSVLARDILLMQANIAHYRGEYDLALEIARGVVRQQRQEALSHSRCNWLSTLAANLCAVGQYGEALDHYREQLEAARHLGLRAQQVTASSDIIATLHDLGRIQEGVPLAEAALELGQYNDTFPLRYHLALAYSRAGRGPAALEQLEQVMNSHSVNMRAHGLALLAEVHSSLGAREATQAALEDGLTLAEGCDILTARAVVVIAVLQFAAAPLLVRAAPLVAELRTRALPAYLQGDFVSALAVHEGSAAREGVVQPGPA